MEKQMKLATYRAASGWCAGVATDKGMLDLAAVSAALAPGERLPVTVKDILSEGKDALGKLEQLVKKAEAEGEESFYRSEDSIEWGPCVPEPGKIICVGLNYRKHAEETNAPIPEIPILFSKFNNALAAHGDSVEIPPLTKKLDYEAELAVVIGRRAKHVPKESALEYVAGYTCANDLSARDLQLQTSQWLSGKSGDRFCPLGPYLVTADEVGDPHALQIRTYVNGELRQNSNTKDMIFKVDELISYISSLMTLEAGDVILTGTPEGVVMGYPPEKQSYLQAGDIVTIEIEKLGRLTNTMAAAEG